MESMLEARRHEDQAAGTHLGVVSPHTDPAATLHDVVDLIFRVRRLSIHAAPREFIEAGAQRWGAEELEVRLPATPPRLEQVWQSVRDHGGSL